MTDKLKLLYKEKVRLAKVANSYAVSSFNDFKMLSALGVLLIAWKPISENLNTGENTSGLLLVGFLVINLTITLIGLLNLSKQSAMSFYFDEVQILEEEIRNILVKSNSKAFHVVDNWNSKGKHKQEKIAKRFTFLFSFVTIILPTVILILYSNWVYPLIYFVLAFLLSYLYFNTMILVHGKL